MVKFSALPSISGGKLLQLYKDQVITTLEVDSRKASTGAGAVFFAIAGNRHDGHVFLKELYERGIRQFIIEKEIQLDAYPEGNFLRVDSSLACLQLVAIHHRNSFSIPVIGITGSNGKTIIKEWLYQLLSIDYKIVKNPGSYNSQLGVPLSVWAMQAYHNLGIFEAGISEPGEMNKLQRIIQPTIGLITNLGSAHDQGFEGDEHKIDEKLKLFDSAPLIIYCQDQLAVTRALKLKYRSKQLIGWGRDAEIRIIPLEKGALSVSRKEIRGVVRTPFSDKASIENVSHCVALMIHLGYELSVIGERILQLKSVPMRLELKQGINHCQIIDDTYNNDIAGLQISLNFLSGMKQERSTLILSDILQSGVADDVWGKNVAQTVAEAGITRFIGIGEGLHANQEKFEKIPKRQFFKTTDDFLYHIDWNDFQNEVVLVKGARSYQFEKVVQHLQKKIHGTIMEIDLNALVNNLNFFKSRLRPGVKLMVMVKAFAYGSGSEEVTHLLQYHKVDYLGVAYPDEGVELRLKRIHLPILVMNPSEESFATLIEYNLEPEIFSLSLLRSLVSFLNGQPCTVHIKLDTGMHRLGFDEDDLNEMVALLSANRNVKVGSIFSHLAGADELQHDTFSLQQSDRFITMAERIKKEIEGQPILHLLNSSGILRFPHLQFGMVRLGIGLYGVNPTQDHVDQLKPVATLKTIISQIKEIGPGESVGYGRNGRTEKTTTLATIAIGYADGYSRSFSNGVGAVCINNKLAPVFGNVCMDMTMVDISGIEASEGDEVVIFGKELPIHTIAAKINTIPYEVLTSIHERIKRIFYTESI